MNHRTLARRQRLWAPRLVGVLVMGSAAAQPRSTPAVAPFSGTLQNVPGDFLTATAVYNSASIQTGASGPNAVPLGRPLAAGGTVTVNLIAPDTVQLPRKTQVDFRLGKSFRRCKLNVTPSVDLINMLNANSVEAFNDRVNATYPGPVRTQFGRFARINILINY